MTMIEPPSGPERAYLDAFRNTSAMPDAARERVWARLSGGPIGPVGGEAANDAGPLLAAAGGGGRAWLSRSGLLFGTSVAVVTGAIVLALQRSEPQLEPPVELAVVAEPERRPTPPAQEIPTPIQEIAPVAASTDPASTGTYIEAMPEPEPTIAKRSSKRARAKPELTIQTSSLADERRLIEQTHAALGKGETDVALALLRRHAVEFATGVFVEEREALLAIATCTAGRLDQGRTAARSFLANYPQAVLAARVRSSCALED